MSTKIIEGVEYILKSSVEQIIKDRVSKVALRANTAEEKITDLNAQLDTYKQTASSVDILNTRIEELQSNLSKSEQKYTRYQSISKHGLSDPEMVEAIEWSYERAMSKLDNDKKSSLSDWLEVQVSNPSEAPTILRPHLKSLQSPTAPPAPTAPTTEGSPEQSLSPSQQSLRDAYSNPSPPVAPVAPPPSANRGAIPSPDEQNFWKEAAENPRFFEQHREEIKTRLADKHRRQ